MASRNTRNRKASRASGSLKGRLDQGKEVRAIARERVGSVKPGQVIVPKDRRKNPKHKQKPDWDLEQGN